ncbi:Fructosamine kinase-domain-containing protein [Coniochaeta sp. 2T2.1]|nr:Fructosamine kinase-domain-containing protein [Coniochaeta sp. 2T2.1]
MATIFSQGAPTLEGLAVSSSDVVLDPAIVSAIGPGKEVISAQRYGNSAWSSSARISVKNSDGSPHDYFVKIVEGEVADKRMLSEYTCMVELYKTMPSIVPTPRAWGQCVELDACFFLLDYRQMDHRPPNAVKLGQKIAELHHRSVSPTGKFGFHIQPYDGKLPLMAEWDGSWISFYGKLLACVYAHDSRVNGLWKEYDDAMHLTLEKVIPRLLGALEEDGESVKPCLIHGNLWEENLGTDPRTGEIYIFDSCAYYAHHEMALGMWRVDHHQMKAKEYRNEYFKNFEPDEPVEEYDDRNRLYSLKERLMYSAHVPGSKARAQALGDMQYLISKYCNEESDGSEE